MKDYEISLAQARRIWLRAQRLDEAEPFGSGPEATREAVEHLGYVQIDTINVVERSHHHILYSRIPRYRRADLHQAQSVDKSVFEYWTHALSYVSVRDLPYFLPAMRAHRTSPSHWYADADPREVRRMRRLIAREGPITIRDVEDELVEKDHPWGSRKPSKRVLQRGFFEGYFVISARTGMLKTYELMERHFGWERPPRAATSAQLAAYRLDRALRAQGLVSASSVMHPYLRFSPDIAALVERRVRRRSLLPVVIEGDATRYWATPEVLETLPEQREPFVRILSPFDPLAIQRRRLKAFFGYDIPFEAYVAKAKRRYGYFVLPVLHGDEIVAGLDLKTDRTAGRVLIQAWHWVGNGETCRNKQAIEAELERFERFQLGDQKHAAPDGGAASSSLVSPSTAN